MPVTAPTGSLACVNDSGTVRLLSPSGTLLGNVSVTLGAGTVINANAVQASDGAILIAQGGAGGAELFFFSSQLAAVVSRTGTTTGGFKAPADVSAEPVFHVRDSTGVQRYSTAGVVGVHTNISVSGASLRQLSVNAAGNAWWTGDTNNDVVYKTTGGVNSSFADRSATASLVYNPGHLLVLQDGTVITNWALWSSATEPFIAAYNSSGTQLWLDTMGATSTDFVSACARGADATYFWAAVYLNASTTVAFRKIRTSDGVVLATFSKPSTDAGFRFDNMAFFELLVDIGSGGGGSSDGGAMALSGMSGGNPLAMKLL